MKKMFERIVVLLMCVALLAGDNAVQVMAEEINAIPAESLEGENHELNNIEAEGENTQTGDADGEDESAEAGNAPEEGYYDASDLPVSNEMDTDDNGQEQDLYEAEDEDLELMEESDPTQVNNATDADTTLAKEKYEFELIDEDTDLSYLSDLELMSLATDIPEESIDCLFYEYPEYLKNEKFDGIIKDAVQQSIGIIDSIDNQDMAVLLEALTKGEEIIWDDFWSYITGGRHDDYQTKHDKAMAKEVIQKYCASSKELTQCAKDVRETYKTLSKVYNLVDNEQMKQFKSELKSKNLLSEKTIDSIVDAYWSKQVGNGISASEDAVELFLVCAEYVELVSIDMQSMEDLEEACRNSGCTKLADDIKLIREDREKNIVSYFTKYYLDDAIFTTLKSELKHNLSQMQIPLNIGSTSISLSNVMSLYSLAQTSLKIAANVYADFNPTVDEMIYASMALNYFNAADINCSKCYTKLCLAKNGQGTVTSDDIRNYEVAYTFELVTAQILASYCYKMVYKQEGSTERCINMIMAMNEVNRLTYSKYLKECIGELKNIGVSISESCAEEEEAKDSIAARFAMIQNQFRPNVGETWIGNWGGCIQCFGFARMVFSQLFGCEMPSAYSGSKPYLYPNESNVIKVGQLEGDSVTAQSVKQLLSQGKLGDIIQASGSVYGQHTMVFVGVGDDYVRVYDCNAAVNGGTAGSCTINEWNISFASFASWYGSGSSCGVTLYRAANYGEIYGDGDYYFYDDSVNFVIEDGVLVKYNGWQRNVVIPDGVTNIGELAFANNTMMYSVYIPECVITIGPEAFCGCTSLQGVYIPNGVAELYPFAFADCSNMKYVRIPKKMSTVLYDEDTLWAKYGTRRPFHNAYFLGCPLGEVIFENEISRIPNYLFCDTLFTMELFQIPVSVSVIGDYSFANCYYMVDDICCQQLEIPNSVISIGEGAFYRWVKLKELIIPNKLLRIESKAFYQCGYTSGEATSDLIIPNSVNTIGREAFKQVNFNKVVFPNKEVYVEEGAFEWSFIKSVHIKRNIITDHCLDESGFHVTDSSIFVGCKWLTDAIIDDGVTSIDAGLFASSGLQKIDLPNTINSIGRTAFYNTKISQISLPLSLKTIGAVAFCKCTNLKTIEFEGIELERIESGAFAHCSVLESISLPDSISFLGDSLFEDCSMLKTVHIPIDQKEICSDMFRNCVSLEEVNLSENLETICGNAFENCDMLTEIVLPYNVSSVASDAFNDCEGLRKITIPRNTSYISDTAFSQKLTICGIRGTYAELYANQNNHTFIANDVHATDFVVANSNLKVCPYGNMNIVLNVEPKNFTDEIEMKSTDTSILTVTDDGVVTGKKIGTATVKITVGNVSKTVEIAVVQNVTVLQLSKTNLTLEVGESYGLSASAYPATANNKEYYWESEDSSIASVDSNGIVSALSRGTTKIYARASDGFGGYGYCTVMVNSSAIAATSVDELQSSHPYPNLCNDMWIYSVEGADKLSVTFSDDTEVEDGFDFIYIYNSNNTQIGKYTGKELAEKNVTIEGDTVKIKLVSDSSGTAYGFRVISAVKKEKEIPLSMIEVEPSSKSLEIGDSCNLIVDYFPENTNVDRTVVWSSNNSGVATVSNGTVTAISQGIAVITAKVGSKSASCMVTVNKKLTTISVNPSELSLFVGQNESIIVNTDTGSIPDDKVQITNSDESVAVVTNDLSEGKLNVEAKAPGTATIEVSVGTVKTSVEITVSQAMVNFMDQDGSRLEYPSVPVTYGEPYPELPIPTKEDLVFIGWFTEPEKTGKHITDDMMFMGVEDLYAGWVSDDGKITILPIEDQIYTGSSICPKPVVYDGLQLLIENVDYKVSYKNNIKANDASVTSSAPTITVTGKGNYTKSTTANFKILKKDIADEDILITTADKAYNGKKCESKPTIKYGKMTLKDKTDYELVFPENITDSGIVTILINGKGNYMGSTSTTYSIFEKGKGMSTMVVSAIPNQIYTGSEIDLDSLPIEVKETKKSTEPLVKDTDYVLEYAPGSNRVNVGTATVQLKGRSGKCMGTKSVTFQITPKALTQDMFVVDDAVYTGTTVKPEVAMTDGGVSVDAANYTVTYSNNTNVASAADKKAPTATIKGKGNYTGTVKVAFDIAPLELAASDLNILLADIKDNKKPITEAAIKPTIKYANPVTKKTVTLKKGTDYTVNYERNIVDDNQHADIILKGNYANAESISIPFRIYSAQTAMNVSDFTAEVDDENLVYTGAKLTPQVVVTDSTTSERVLTEGKDYTLAYLNNINAADKNASGVNVNKLPTVKITGKGLYKGTFTQTFSIQPMALSESDFDIVIGDILCNSKKEQTPKVTVTNTAAKKALKNTDYTVTVVGSTKNVSEAIAITISGKGNYSGTVNKTFRVYGNDISKIVFDKVDNQAYTGSTICPSGDAVKVYSDKKKTVRLIEGTDYVLEYGENIKAGSGSVMVKGIGKYGGSKTVKFTIVPKWLEWLLL